MLTDRRAFLVASGSCVAATAAGAWFAAPSAEILVSEVSSGDARDKAVKFRIDGWDHPGGPVTDSRHDQVTIRLNQGWGCAWR